MSINITNLIFFIWFGENKTSREEREEENRKREEHVKKRLGIWVGGVIEGKIDNLRRQCLSFQKVTGRWVFFKITLYKWVFYPISLFFFHVFVFWLLVVLSFNLQPSQAVNPKTRLQDFVRDSTFRGPRGVYVTTLPLF